MASAVTPSKMSWEFALPVALAGGALDAASGASDPPMDNEAFVAFYERSARFK